MILSLALAACTPDTPDTAEAVAYDVVDLRLTEADLPALGEGDAVWWGPDEVVEPGEDKMFCIFGTYTGEDAGIHALSTYQNTLGHHLLLMGTTASELDFPDGSVADCSAEGDLSMADLEPLVLPTSVQIGGVDRDLGIDLLDGMAVKIDQGQRWVLQAHYLNTGVDPIRVHDPAVLNLMPEAEVETWAAPFVLNSSDFRIPAQESATHSFDCEVPQDLNVLYVTGHMHEWGTAFRTEQIGLGTVYEQTEWDPEWRDSPPVQAYAPGSYLIPAGSTLRTTCNWFNDTDEDLTFPSEMCDTVTVVYPQLTALICDGEG